MQDANYKPQSISKMYHFIYRLGFSEFTRYVGSYWLFPFLVDCTFKSFNN